MSSPEPQCLLRWTSGHAIGRWRWKTAKMKRLPLLPDLAFPSLMKCQWDCNAAATFERIMQQVFNDMSWQTTLVYFYGIIVSWKRFEDELNHLREVFTCLAEANLKLGDRKCQLFQRSAEFLRHTVSGDVIACQDSNCNRARLINT